ncbi:MAG: carboxypeptidase-like regulatory domain-containing protein, partial [bacterium]|nr:carboxypeptidase-like regulatory domain-containing protein [bacterium]
EGEYEIITVMDYQDPELANKEIRLIAVVDPEGYVYEKIGDKEARVSGAIVSLYWLNPETKQYGLWPAQDYQQENPQITNNTGKYSFLVPQGSYYLTIEAPSYLIYEGKPFQVKEGSGVHLNIELKTKYWWLKYFDWKTGLLILVIILLLYNFYRDKIRERLSRKS